MINISVTRRDGAIVEVHMDGHAGYSEHGTDIVCAAISALTCTAILGLVQVADQKGQFDNESGCCDIVLNEPVKRGGQDILETMLLGCKEIAKQFPAQVAVYDNGR